RRDGVELWGGECCRVERRHAACRVVHELSPRDCQRRRATGFRSRQERRGCRLARGDQLPCVDEEADGGDGRKLKLCCQGSVGTWRSVLADNSLGEQVRDRAVFWLIRRIDIIEGAVLADDDDNVLDRRCRFVTISVGALIFFLALAHCRKSEGHQYGQKQDESRAWLPLSNKGCKYHAFLQIVAGATVCVSEKRVSALC